MLEVVGQSEGFEEERLDPLSRSRLSLLDRHLPHQPRRAQDIIVNNQRGAHSNASARTTFRQANLETILSHLSPRPLHRQLLRRASTVLGRLVRPVYLLMRSGPLRLRVSLGYHRSLSLRFFLSLALQLSRSPKCEEHCSIDVKPAYSRSQSRGFPVFDGEIAPRTLSRRAPSHRFHFGDSFLSLISLCLHGYRACSA